MVSVETLAGPSFEEGGSAFRPGGISPKTMVLPAAAGAALMLTKKVWADWLARKVNAPEAGEKSVPGTAVPPMACQPTVMTVPAPLARVTTMGLDWPSAAVGLVLAKLSTPPKSLSSSVNSIMNRGPSCAGGLGFMSVIVKVSGPSAMLSLMVLIGMVRTLTPGGKTSVPGRRSKSSPWMAVPLVAWYCTETLAASEPVRTTTGWLFWNRLANWMTTSLSTIV